jgi:hypothetical protein
MYRQLCVHTIQFAYSGLGRGENEKEGSKDQFHLGIEGMCGFYTILMIQNCESIQNPNLFFSRDKTTFEFVRGMHKLRRKGKFASPAKTAWLDSSLTILQYLLCSFY